MKSSNFQLFIPTIFLFVACGGGGGGSSPNLDGTWSIDLTLRSNSCDLATARQSRNVTYQAQRINETVSLFFPVSRVTVTGAVIQNGGGFIVGDDTVRRNPEMSEACGFIGSRDFNETLTVMDVDGDTIGSAVIESSVVCSSTGLRCELVYEGQGGRI